MLHEQAPVRAQDRRTVLRSAALGITTLALPSPGVAASPEGEVSAAPGPTILTARPAGFMIPGGTGTESATVTGAVELTWTAIDGALGYVVRARLSSDGPSGAFGTIDASETTSAVVIGLDATQDYDLAVAATGAGGVTITADSSPVLAVGTVIATGGTVTTFVANGTNGTDGARYVVHSFTSPGTATLVLARDHDLEHLVVGAGGAGGTAGADTSSGGGGGGRVVTGTVAATAGEYDVTIGAGGTPTAVASLLATGGAAADGGSSSLALAGGATVAAALGGGGGASAMIGVGNQGPASTTGWTGGGGAVHAQNTRIGSTGVGGSGTKGGDPFGSGTSGDVQAAGGGGGSGGAGANAASSAGGAGGAGTTSSITGTGVTYGGGGGGGKRTATGTAGTGTGGGGAGGRAAPGSGGARGGGGGGAGSANVGGAGGDGVVIVRYALPA